MHRGVISAARGRKVLIFKMKEFQLTQILPGAEVICVEANRFKTNELSVTLTTPLLEQTAAQNAVAAHIVSSTCAQYPTIGALSRRLAGLYGAQLGVQVTKSGDFQQLRFNMTCLDDRFSLDGERISGECVKLLLSLLFEPSLDENGAFLPQDTQREKRIIIEKIESDENEKRIYALERAQQIMFEGEPFAVGKMGTAAQVEAVTPLEAANAWRTLLKTAKITFICVGSADCSAVPSQLKARLEALGRSYAPPTPSPSKPPAQVRRVTERQEVRQGKLVMGFYACVDANSAEQGAVLRAFCDIFGGGPYSKLFANVREKMSLCYYCSARPFRRKSCLFVQSGCEEQNMQRAQEEILNQLSCIENGDFDYEFTSSAAAIADMLGSVGDSPESIEAWYSAQCADGEYISPQESARLHAAVTKEQIAELAKTVRLGAVYTLAGNKEAQE